MSNPNFEPIPDDELDNAIEIFPITFFGTGSDHELDFTPQRLEVETAPKVLSAVASADSSLTSEMINSEIQGLPEHQEGPVDAEKDSGLSKDLENSPPTF